MRPEYKDVMLLPCIEVTMAANTWTTDGGELDETFRYECFIEVINLYVFVFF